jgi:hypothetical protein
MTGKDIFISGHCYLKEICMKKIYILTLFGVIAVLSGCEAIGTVFKGGMWFGIIIVVAVIILIAFLVSRSKK